MNPQYVDFIVEGGNFYFKIDRTTFSYMRDKYESMVCYHEKDDEFHVQITFVNSKFEFRCKQRSKKDLEANPIMDSAKRKEWMELVFKQLNKNLIEGQPIGLAVCNFYVYEFLFTN